MFYVHTEKNMLVIFLRHNLGIFYMYNLIVRYTLFVFIHLSITSFTFRELYKLTWVFAGHKKSTRVTLALTRIVRSVRTIISFDGISLARNKVPYIKLQQKRLERKRVFSPVGMRNLLKICCNTNSSLTHTAARREH